MQYRQDKYGNQLSALGFGCLRFQRKMGSIDYEKAERQIMLAINGGVNYFDTAFIYPGSEAVLGEVLEKNNVRDKVYIATKIPHYLVKSIKDMDRIFAEELRRLRTDHVDYYLMHMLTDADAWERMKAMGAVEWLQEKQASGTIGQVGFSYHGNSDMFCRLVDAYDWDFCQIQYNYLDEHSQAGRKGLNHAHANGLPVIIMEPLRGGKLVNLLPEEGKKIMARYPVQHTPAQWALHWLWDQKEVTVVLSGMNTEEMVLDNLQTASDAHVGELGEGEQAMLREVVRAINAKIKVGCTGCGYCMPCPRGVDIPGTFAAYNRFYSENKFSGLREYFMCTALRKTGTGISNCIGCGKCEKHCPQGIEIHKHLQDAKKKLEFPGYSLLKKAATKIVKF